MATKLTIPTPGVVFGAAGAALDVSQEQPIASFYSNGGDDDSFLIQSSLDDAAGPPVNWSNVCVLKGKTVKVESLAANAIRAVRVSGATVTAGIITMATNAGTVQP